MTKKYGKISLIFTIIPVMVVLLLLVAGSYAIFSTDLNPVKIHTLTIGDLYAAKLSITDNGYVNLVDAVPLSNDLGMKGDATSLTLENIGDEAAIYSIILLDDKTSYSDYSGSVLPDSTVKYGIVRNNNIGRTISLLSNATEYCSDATITTYSDCKSSQTAESGRIIMTGKIAVGEKVDYKLRLWINYEAGNAYQENRYYGQVKVIIGKDLGVDINRPYIVLNGDSEVNLDMGENYYEEGILAALDKEDGDVSNTLSISGNVDTTIPGIYHVSYSVYDSMGQNGFATRTVIVKNPVDCGVVFNLVGSNPYTHILGSTYEDPGVTAVDASDNPLTVTTNSLGLDVDTVGQYHIIYSATAGSCTEYAYRLVEVTMGSGGYITYTPNGSEEKWSSNSITATITPSEDIIGIVPASFKYKIGTYEGNNIIYGNEMYDDNLSATLVLSTSGRYVISTTLVGTTGIEIRNLLSNIFYIDKTPPACGTPTYTATPAFSGSPTTWIQANRSISITSCQDPHSGCDGASLTKIFDTTTSTGTITIADKAYPVPNTSICSVDVYVDKTPPECGAITNANTTWTKTLANPIGVACSDVGSGCSTQTFNNDFSGHTGITGIITLSDKTSPANTTNCTVNTYMDNGFPTAPTITGTTGTNTWATSNTLTISGGSALSGIASYQYCNSVTNSSSGCTWNDYDASNKPIYNTNGTTYVFARALNAANTPGTPSSAYIVKIDITPPVCVLSVTTSGVSFASKTDNVAVTNYGMNTTGTAEYNESDNLALEIGTKYGFVIDQAGNSNSCSATLTDTYTRYKCSKSALVLHKYNCSYTYYNKEATYCTNNNYSFYSETCSQNTTIGGSCNCKDITNYTSMLECRAACGGTCSGATCTEIIPGTCTITKSCTCTASSQYSNSCTLSYTYPGKITCYEYQCSTGTLSGSNCYLDNQTSCATNWEIDQTQHLCATGTKLNNTYCYVIN